MRKYTEDYIEQFYSIISGDPAEVWNDLRHLSQASSAAAWKTHYENVIKKYNLSGRFALMRLLSVGSQGSLVSYIGAVLFFASDCTLFLVRYFRNPDVIFKRHFTVMLTYLAGELLIVLGLLMG